MDDLNTVARCGECAAGLKTCNARKDVKYCSVKCALKHTKEGKQRAARLHDESLFKQPPPKDDCPICFLPMPFACNEVAVFFNCCGNNVCDGCFHSCVTSEIEKCPFCNAEEAYENEIIMERMKKRARANDANSMCELGCLYWNGKLGLRKDSKKAFELWTQAAELGSIDANYYFGDEYLNGESVEKNMKKAIHHYELAAMAGHETARYNLGDMEDKSGNMERAIKHWMISASAGDSASAKLPKHGLPCRQFTFNSH